MGADKGAHTPASPCCCLCTEHPIPDAFWHLLPGLQRSHQLEGGTAAYLKARLCWYLACPSLHLLLSPSNLQLGAATSDNPRLLHIPKPSPLLPNASSSSLAVTQAALLPPGTAPSQGAGREVGVSPHPFLPGVTTSCHCSKSKQRPAHLFCDLLLSSYTPASPGPGPTAGRRWPLRPFQPRRHRGKPRVTSERWRGGPRRRAACRRRGPTGGFPRPPPLPRRPSPQPRGRRRGEGLPARGSVPVRAKPGPARGGAVNERAMQSGRGGRVVGGSPGRGGGRPLSSPPLGPPPPPPPEAPACCCLPRWRRPPRPGGTWRRRPAGGACGLGSRIIPPAAGRCLAGRRAGGGAARRAGGAAAWPPAAAGRQRSPPAGARPPAPPQRSAAPAPGAAEGGQSRGGRAAAEAGGTGWGRGGTGCGAVRCGGMGARRRVTLRRRRQAGRQAARRGRPSGAHRQRSRCPGAAGEGSRCQPRRGGVRLAGAAGRASDPAGMLMGR